MPGPPPDPNARRSNNRADWTELPATCTRPVPVWPFEGDVGDVTACPVCSAVEPDDCVTPGGRKAKSPHRARIIARINRDAGLPHSIIARWRHLWTLPQAEIWHEQNAARLVARLVLVLDIAESPGGALDPRYSAEARQIEDRLLLSPDRFIRARYTVAKPDAEAGGKVATVAVLDEYRDLYG